MTLDIADVIPRRKEWIRGVGGGGEKQRIDWREPPTAHDHTSATQSALIADTQALVAWRTRECLTLLGYVNAIGLRVAVSW
jgi:hypothetical protein